MEHRNHPLPPFSELRHSCGLNQIEPQWFGLGFIQLKISSHERLHFWHPGLKQDTDDEEVHDHRYWFTSEVLAGEVLNATYQFISDPYGSFVMESVSCKEGEEVRSEGYGYPKYICSTVMAAGSRYLLPAHTLHKTVSEFAITRLKRDGFVSERAHVIRRKTSDRVCPFARKIAVETLWTYIEECYQMAENEHQGQATVAPPLPSISEAISNYERKANLPGYHVADIPKGILGEPSKIVEEALELVDAWEQDAIIMEQVELADLFGAIEAYMTKRLPHLTIEDVSRFSDITKRAFQNGRR